MTIVTVFVLAVIAVVLGNLIAWGVQRIITHRSRVAHPARSMDDDLKGAAHA